MVYNTITSKKVWQRRNESYTKCSRKGASLEEIGKIKDKHDKRKKDKKVTELEHGKIYTSGGKKYKYNAKAKGDELAMVPVDDEKVVTLLRTTDGKMKKNAQKKWANILEES